MAHAAIQPLSSVGLDAITEAFEELRLHAPGARTPGSNQLLNFDYGRFKRQLGAFLGPWPSWQDLRHLTFSFANGMAQITEGEPLPPCGATHDSIPRERRVRGGNRTRRGVFP